MERLHWRQAVEHVLSCANQGGPVAEQLVGASRAGVEWIAGNRTDFAGEIGGVARGDQRAGALGGFERKASWAVSETVLENPFWRLF